MGKDKKEFFSFETRSCYQTLQTEMGFGEKFLMKKKQMYGQQINGPYREAHGTTLQIAPLAWG
jgi:hypothetical protein